MSSTEGTPARRRRARRADALPRVPELDALLREVDALRLTLETDLSLAAAAVEAGEPALARDVIDADRDAVANFEAHALGRLDALAEHDERTPRHRVRVPTHAATFVAAAALVGLLAGVLPQAISNRPAGPSTPAAATESLERLQELVLTGDASEIRAASAELHEQLASVVAVAATDPAAAQNALLLLSYEQSVISRSADRSELADVLRQSQALARAIRAALPASARAAVPTAPKLPATAATASPKGTASPKPSPTPTRKTSSSSSPKPSSTPSPSSNPYQLPQPPIQP
jgi:hypothetical protein